MSIITRVTSLVAPERAADRKVSPLGALLIGTVIGLILWGAIGVGIWLLVR